MIPKAAATSEEYVTAPLVIGKHVLTFFVQLSESTVNEVLATIITWSLMRQRYSSPAGAWDLADEDYYYSEAMATYQQTLNVIAWRGPSFLLEEARLGYLSLQPSSYLSSWLQLRIAKAAA